MTPPISVKVRVGRVCTDHTESTQGLKEGKEEVRVRRGNRGPKSAHPRNQVQGQGQAQAPRPPHTVESSWREEPGPVLSFTSFLSTGCITMSLIGEGGGVQAFWCDSVPLATSKWEQKTTFTQDDSLRVCSPTSRPSH